MFKDLDPILHAQLRLAVMSLLIGVKEAEFTFLKEKSKATAGNLSIQLNKLKEAGYTRKGVEAFEAYVLALQSYTQNPES
jgi:DNA-binding transcriptional ArsR family regulator